MAYSSVTIGDTTQTAKRAILDVGNFVASQFRIDYDPDHASPGFTKNPSMPVQFTRVESLTAGATINFAVWDAKGKKGKPPKMARSGDVFGGGGAVWQTAARTLHGGNVYFLSDTDKTFYVGMQFKKGNFAGFTTTNTTPGSVTQYSSTWKTIGTAYDPMYAKVYYNTVPTKPLTPNVTASLTPSNSIQFAWGAPTSDGGDSIDGYRIQWSTDSQFERLVGSVRAKRNVRTYLAKGLKSATTYYFRVAALNGVSDAMGGGHSSPWSDTASGDTAAGSDVEQIRNDVAENNYLAVRKEQSAYGVQDSEGRIVPNRLWLDYGASVQCDVSGPGELALTLIGPRSDIPNYPGPYTLAIRDDDGVDNPALTIRGRGVSSEPHAFKLPTGASPTLIGVEDTRKVENVALGDRELTYGRSTLTMREHAGNTSTISFTISGPQATTFLPGTTFSYDKAVWRVMTATITNATADVTARMFTTADAYDAAWAGKTVDDQITATTGRVIDDLGIKPLYGTS